MRLTVVNDELPLEVREELHVLLLLARAHNLQLLAEQRLELLLQAERIATTVELTTNIHVADIAN